MIYFYKNIPQWKKQKTKKKTNKKKKNKEEKKGGGNPKNKTAHHWSDRSPFFFTLYHHSIWKVPSSYFECINLVFQKLSWMLLILILFNIKVIYLYMYCYHMILHTVELSCSWFVVAPSCCTVSWHWELCRSNLHCCLLNR